MEQDSAQPIQWQVTEAFLRFAKTLAQVVRQFVEMTNVTRDVLGSTQEELLSAVRVLAQTAVLPAELAEGLITLVQEAYQRASLDSAQPSEDAIKALLNSIYASARLILNDLALLETGASKAAQRSERKAVANLFRPIYAPLASSDQEPAPLSQGLILAERRLDAFEKRRSAHQFSATYPRWRLSRRRAKTSDHRVSDHEKPFPAHVVAGAPGSVLYSAPPTELSAMKDRTYKVWYGTNRAPLRPTDEALGYGGEQDLRLHFGYCHVFVPRNHQTGSLGTSWLQRLMTFSPDDRLKLRERFPLDREAFQRKMETELAEWSGTRTGLVYIHGFRVTFDQAACLAAQIGCDLEVNGVISFFSWPAAGKLDRYVLDRETADLEPFVPHLVDFIDTLLSVSKLDRVNIIAHSMGNRVLAAAIAKIQKLVAARNVSIGHLVLAAPDISRVEFSHVAQLYKATARERVTLYTCKRDRALLASNKVNGYLRIGFEPPVYCHEALDTVSVSPIRLGLLGHGYISAAKPVIADLKRLLWLNQPPVLRELEPVPAQGVADYWRLISEGGE